MWIPNIDYLQIVLLLFCQGFFARGARIEERSPFVWCAMSLALWLLFTNVLVAGVNGGLLSQLILYVGLGVHGMLRERRARRHRER